MWLPSYDHIRFLGKLTLAQCVALYGETLLHMAIWSSAHKVIWPSGNCNSLCSLCSSNEAPLAYLNMEPRRVCDFCYDNLKKSICLKIISRNPVEYEQSFLYYFPGYEKKADLTSLFKSSKISESPKNYRRTSEHSKSKQTTMTKEN